MDSRTGNKNLVLGFYSSNKWSTCWEQALCRPPLRTSFHVKHWRCSMYELVYPPMLPGFLCINTDSAHSSRHYASSIVFSVEITACTSWDHCENHVSIHMYIWIWLYLIDDIIVIFWEIMEDNIFTYRKVVHSVLFKMSPSWWVN